jgi:hypothetical protein
MPIETLKLLHPDFATVLAAAARPAADTTPPEPVVIGGDAGQDRVVLMLTTARYNFRLVSIDDEIYPLYAHQGLAVDAPIGTRVYAADDTSPLQPEGTEMMRIAAGHHNCSVAVD